jgi:hypothetical protein
LLGAERIVRSHLVPRTQNRYDLVVVNRERGDIIEHMERDDFGAAVMRAQQEFDQAKNALATLILWQQRLQPYLDGHPQATIAEAIDLYNAEHAR